MTWRERARTLAAAGGRIEPEQDLEAQQRALEGRLAALSEARGLAQLERAEARGAESETSYGARAVAQGIDALAAAIRRDRVAAEKKRGARPEALELLAPLEPETAAYLCLRGLLDQLSRQPRLSTAAARIGGLVEEEIGARAAETVDRAAARGAVAARPGRRRRLDAALKAAVVRRWSARQRQLAGLRLLDLALESSDLAEVVETPIAGDPKKRAWRLAPSASAVAARDRAAAAAERIAPLYEPMIAEPRPWRSAQEGGYLSGQIGGLTLVKTREREALAALTPERAPLVFDAVNAAQRTRWRINARLLDALRAVEADPEAAAAATPPREAEPAPSQAESSGAERWRWFEAEHRRRSRRLAFDRMRAQAERFEAASALYFPYQYDFRGRLYAVSEFCPQGPDPMKALLQFADGEALGPEGWRWLAIHLCNCGDFERMSKAPLRARVAWTLANEERVLTVAADPLADLWWTEADQPWQFLAACFEWEGFRREGEAFRSRLAVALDGSCSGLQHFSLALRDEIGGAAVNLRARGPDASASDIYAEVASAVEALLTADLASEETFSVGKDAAGEPRRRPVAELARAWLAFGVDRKLCKRPTMTYGYGARGYGYVEQILEDTLRPAYADRQADPARPWPFEGRGFGEALYLAARMTEAIERTVLKAAEAMRWLQAVADQAAAEGEALAWTTPDGFPVHQAYRERVDRRVKTRLAGRPIRLTLREETGRLDARRQRQGVAPNYVHALDACHLRLIVARAVGEGARDFALVHDSFGVHAARTPRFFQIIREALVEMYDKVDVIAAFREEIAARLGDGGGAALQPAPERGRLQLHEVLENDHCFS